MVGVDGVGNSLKDRAGFGLRRDALGRLRFAHCRSGLGSDLVRSIGDVRAGPPAVLRVDAERKPTWWSAAALQLAAPRPIRAAPELRRPEWKIA